MFEKLFGPVHKNVALVVDEVPEINEVGELQVMFEPLIILASGIVLSVITLTVPVLLHPLVFSVIVREYVPALVTCVDESVGEEPGGDQEKDTFC